MRQAVAHLKAAFGVSERRACFIIKADRKSVRYRSCRPPDTALRERLRALAVERRRFGYRRLFVLLRREGEPSVHTANELDSCGQNEWAPRATLGMFLAVVNGRQSYSTKLSRPFAGSNRSQKKSWR